MKGRSISAVWRKIRDAAVFIALAGAVIGIITAPKEVSGAVRNSMDLCIDVVIPSLFPFFVLSTLIIEMGFAGYAGKLFERLMKPLFRLNGICGSAVVLGFLGGYPIGAKTAISLYEKKLITKTEAERLLSFCNNSGPAFVLGAVGAGILGSSMAGFLLYLSHTAASLTVGLLFRGYGKKSTKEPICLKTESISSHVPNFPAALVKAIKAGASSMFGICAFVIFFTVITTLLYISGILPGFAGVLVKILAPFNISKKAVLDILTGFIEMTSGIVSLKGSELMTGKLAMVGFMLGWAGLSVHFQVLNFIGSSGLSSWTYFVGKLAHGIIAALYTAVIMMFIGHSKTLPTYLAGQVESLAGLDFSVSFTGSLLLAGGIFIAFVLISVKKKGEML